MEHSIVISTIILILWLDWVRPCPEGLQFVTKTFEGKCYQFVPVKKTWFFAKIFCHDNGGELVSIKNQRVMDFLKRNLDGDALQWTYSGVWIGINDMDKEGTWRWDENIPLNYTNWASGQPAYIWPFNKNEDCGCMEHVWKWRWHDYPCSNEGYLNKWICQYNASAKYTANRRMHIPTPMTLPHIWFPQESDLTTSYIPTSSSQSTPHNEPHRAQKSTTHTESHKVSSSGAAVNINQTANTKTGSANVITDGATKSYKVIQLPPDNISVGTIVGISMVCSMIVAGFASMITFLLVRRLFNQRKKAGLLDMESITSVKYANLKNKESAMCQDPEVLK